MAARGNGREPPSRRAMTFRHIKTGVSAPMIRRNFSHELRGGYPVRRAGEGRNQLRIGFEKGTCLGPTLSISERASKAGCRPQSGQWRILLGCDIDCAL